MNFEGRTINGCNAEFACYAHTAARASWSSTIRNWRVLRSIAYCCCLHEFARQYRSTPSASAISSTSRPVRTSRADLHVSFDRSALLSGRAAANVPASAKQNSREVGSYSLIDLDLSRYNQIGARFAREKQESTEFLKSGIKTRNAAFNQMIARIERVAARSKAPLMLNGPTGAGKSTLARRIYELKKSRHQIQGEFVEVNCATLRGDAALSTLFGHVKGAFTGAQADRAGLLRKAHGGVVFLDEIGELGIDEQTMLLKAIEESASRRWARTRKSRATFS